MPNETGASMLDCNSAEWCILAYILDLSLNCSTLKNRDKFPDLKRLFSTPCEPSMSNCTLTDKKFGLEYIANPRKKVDPLTIKLLIDNPQHQYNLVCNVLMEVCGVSFVFETRKSSPSFGFLTNILIISVIFRLILFVW